MSFSLGGIISGAPAAKEGILISSDPRKHLSNTELVAVFSWNKCCFFVNSPGGRDKFWPITYSWAQSSHSGSSDNRKLAPSTQRPLRMNVFAVTLGETSSAGLDLLSLCTSNEMGEILLLRQYGRQHRCENALTHSQCSVSLSCCPSKTWIYRSITLTSSSRSRLVEPTQYQPLALI